VDVLLSLVSQIGNVHNAVTNGLRKMTLCGSGEIRCSMVSSTIFQMNQQNREVGDD
jgi:hypothetical protein